MKNMYKPQSTSNGAIMVVVIGLLITVMGVFFTAYSVGENAVTLIPIGVLFLVVGVFAYSRRNPACQDCGVRDGTVALYVRYGNGSLMGLPVPAMTRLVCSNCRKKYELQDKGLRICEHCGETIPLEGNCPNCGAP